MGQTPDQIEHHIEQTRETLGANLHELEHKVKRATDWKQQFREHPMTLIGVAFGGGVLLAKMLGGRRHNGVRHFSDNSIATGTVKRKHEALDTWDNIKGALIGVAATRVKDYVSGIVPGFGEQFERTQQEKSKVRLGDLHG